MRDLANDVLDNVLYRAVAVQNDAHNLVAEGQGSGIADDRAGLGSQVVDVHDVQAGSLQALLDLRTVGVNGDTVLGNDNVNVAARGDEGGYLVNDAGDAAAQQRANDNRQGAVLSSVGVTAEWRHE